MLEGNGIYVVSQNVYRQQPGDAVSVAPSNPGHILINDTEEPLNTLDSCSVGATLVVALSTEAHNS